MKNEHETIEDLLLLDKEYFSNYAYSKFIDYESIKDFTKELSSSNYFAIKRNKDSYYLYRIEQNKLLIREKNIILFLRREKIIIYNNEMNNFNLFFKKNKSILTKENQRKMDVSFETLYEYWIKKELFFFKLNNKNNIRNNLYSNNKLLNIINRNN